MVTEPDHTSPRIISPGEHPILKEMIDDDALRVLQKLNSNGYAAYLVGGGVRDLYLGKKPKDFDISTDARPGQVRKLFSNSRTIGRRFRLVQIFFGKNKVIEVSTLRSLSEHDLDGPESVLAPNNTYGTLDQDAQRRDITINGLFYEIENQTIIDYVGGVSDLDNSVIRVIGTPEKRIQRDPVRMMRVIRHSARNGFTIDRESWDAVCNNTNRLPLCPPSRLRDELLRDIYSGYLGCWFELARDTELFTRLFSPYRELLPTEVPDGSSLSCREQLGAICQTIDRHNHDAIEAGRHRPPDYFMLSLLLLPWAAIRFNLFNTQLKGPQLFHLAKRIRTEINDSIGLELNLRRSARQEITTLLAHLPLIIQHRKSGGWPKWLRKKSYFTNCRTLYYYYREATRQIPAPETPPHIAPSKRVRVPHEKRRSGSRRNRGRPIISERKKGGIFGLKK